MSPSAGRAQHRVGDGVAHDVGVGVAQRGRGRREWSRRRAPAAARHQAVQVVALCRSGSTGRRVARQPLGQRAGPPAVVIFTLRGSPSTRRTGMPGALGERGLVGGVAAARQRVAQHRDAKRLRRLREIDLLARHASRPRGRRRRRASRCRWPAPRPAAAPCCDGRRHRAVDEIGDHERPRGVVNHHDRRRAPARARTRSATESWRRAPPSTSDDRLVAPTQIRPAAPPASSGGSATTRSRMRGCASNASTLRCRIGTPPRSQQLLGPSGAERAPASAGGDDG